MISAVLHASLLPFLKRAAFPFNSSEPQALFVLSSCIGPAGKPGETGDTKPDMVMAFATYISYRVVFAG